MSFLGLGAGGLLIVYGALVAVAARLQWRWFLDHPQVRRAVKARGQRRVTHLLTVIGLGVFVLGLIIFIASLGQLNSA